MGTQLTMAIIIISIVITLSPGPRPSSHIQGGAAALQGTQSMTDTSLPALNTLANATSLGSSL